MLSAVDRADFLTDINIPTLNTVYTLPTQGGQIPNDYFLWGLRLVVEARMTNPAAGNPTGTQAEAPYSLIENIQVEGYHRPRRAKEQFINLRGSDLRELVRDYSGSAPYTTPATLSVAASATNDIRFFLDLPFVPLGLPTSSQLQWLLDAPNYDALTLRITFADALSVFTGQTTQPTFSAFGSAAGNPRIRVSRLITLAGPSAFRGIIPGRLWRYFQENTSSDLTSTATGVRLFNIPRGNKIRALMLKTGVKSAAVTAGNNVYNTLSNTILANIKIFRGINKVIRYWPDYLSIQEEDRLAYLIAPNSGYALIDFAKHETSLEILDLRRLIAGPTGDVDVFLAADVTGAASQAIDILVEEWRGSMVNLARR